VPYQFEPEYSDSELENIPLLGEDNPTVNIYAGRKGSVEWCKCRICKPMPTDHESLCCAESEVIGKVKANYECVTENPIFSSLIVFKEALNILRHQTIRKTKSNKKKNSLAATELPNNSWRYLAYKQFVLWVNANVALGSGNRVVIPSCVVNKIRENFPDPTSTYTGYRAREEGDIPKWPL
jgi:hypothetical protein